MDTDRLRQHVESFPFWYHRIALPGGIVTPGWAPLDVDAYQLPADLTGQRVLDVGAWDGFWSFEALQRGAAQVVAIDDFSDFLGTLEAGDRKAWDSFDLCREALGYDAEICQRHEMSLYDLTPETFGRFDIVFCFGVLYHLRHPLLGIDRLAAVCTGDMFVESAILDDYSPYRGGLGHGYGGDMVMEFYPGDEYASNASNWWAPTLRTLGNMVKSAGFEKVRGWKLTGSPEKLSHCRGFIRASREETSADG